MPNINQLESLDAFRVVVDKGSFSAAARELKVSTSWISKRVDRLESFFQTRLLNRNTRHVGLTLNGARCYERAVELLDLWDDLSRDMVDTDNALEGQIRVTAPMSWGLVQLSPLMNKFSKAYPGITFDMSLCDQHVNIVSGNYDLALRITEQLQDSSLLSRKIRSYRRVLCASSEFIRKKGDPDSIEDLNSFNPLVFSMDSNPVKWKFFKAAKEYLLNVEPYVVSNNSLLLKSHLISGDGIALMPEFLIDQELKDGTLVELLKGYTASNLNLYSLRPGGRSATNRLNVFLDFLYQELRSL